MRNCWGGRRGMRCACTLACCAEWMVTGHDGVEKKYSTVQLKRAVCAGICLKIVAGQME